jgi:hypothetical protein
LGPERIGAAFLPLVKLLRLYTEYCTGHHLAIQRLQEKEKDSAFAAFIEVRERPTDRPITNHCRTGGELAV